mmetsp:Transcript_15720/g.36204  ORF Transcript_15720/g.36204 Transcript_15720/m.36204 type:complete len:507 (-) Transcript_15720:25-1545(-)
MMLATATRRAPLLSLVVASLFLIIKDETTSPLLLQTLRGRTSYVQRQLYVPPSLDIDSQRALSLDLGNGNCRWTPPAVEVPSDIDFHKTVIAGFPSGDKRMIFIQMESLTGWPARDEWDFKYLGMTNHPFIKANYPHHEGYWGWGQAADQVVMMVRNIRRSMVEYHDILWDLGFPKTYGEARQNIGDLYLYRPPLEDFLSWRDERVLDECYWYSWFIDYWMEGGLMRDMFTHKITTAEHWYMLMEPTGYQKEDLAYDLVVGNDTIVTPSYDPHCTNGDMTDGCEPVAVFSGEKLRITDSDAGKAETTAIANALLNDSRMGQYVIDQSTWDCIWEELIVTGRGARTVFDRPLTEVEYNFSAEMLETMIQELDYIIDKYSSPEWNSKVTANRVVELVSEHKSLVQTELDEVNSGVRKLKDTDFLGPRERARRAVTQGTDKPDNSKYFIELEKQIKKQKDARKMASALRAFTKRREDRESGTQSIEEWWEYTPEDSQEVKATNSSQASD